MKRCLSSKMNDLGKQGFREKDRKYAGVGAWKSFVQKEGEEGYGKGC